MTRGSATPIDAAVRDADHLARAREPNQGAACTTASVLTVLRSLGAAGLPPLGEATVRLGARRALGPPPLRAYVRFPWERRAPLDRAVEALAAEAGLRVRSRTRLALPWPAPRAHGAGILIANLAYGQEAPGRRGTWGWHPLRPRTYAAGGHSVVIAHAGPGGRRLVVDPNWPGVQRWRRPGWAVTVTEIEVTDPPG